jgi:anti-sigma regulatory factor (Ser/Thr protein kinase)
VAALPFHPEAARTARTMVGRLLVGHHCPEQLVEDGRLVVHELVVNGITHGAPGERSEIEVACRLLAGHVQISVLDHGHAGAVEVQASSVRRPNGRGLAIVEALSDSWSVDRTHGTLVSAWLAR